MRRVALVPGGRLDDPTYRRVFAGLSRALRPLGFSARPCRPSSVRSFAPDLVHLHVTGRVPRLPPGMPLVVTFQDLDHPDLPKASERELRALVHRASAVTALTSPMAKELRARFGRKVSVIGNGVGESFFAAGRGGAGPIVSVGRLAPYKGMDLLLWAFADVLRSHPSARLEILGRDFQRGHHRRLARRLGLSSSVRFLGDRGRVESVLRKACVFVGASRRETYGMAVLEAMASGAPVLATRTGAAPSLIRDGRSGLLVAPGDPAALSRGLNRLLSDSSLRRRFSSEGRKAAAAHTWAARASAYAAAYEEALR